MPYHVSIDLKDEEGYCIDGVADPKKFVAAAKKEGGVWLGLDAFVFWDTISCFWFTDEAELAAEDEEPNGNKIVTIN